MTTLHLPSLPGFQSDGRTLTACGLWARADQPRISWDPARVTCPSCLTSPAYRARAAPLCADCAAVGDVCVGGPGPCPAVPGR